MTRSKTLFISVAALTLCGLVPAPSHAELGPTHVGLPGLAETLTVPERTTPLRFGLHYRVGRVDPGHGFAWSDSLFGGSVLSSELRLQGTLSASRGVLLAVAVPYRWWSNDLEEGSGWGDIDISALGRFVRTERWLAGAFGRLAMPTGREAEGLSTEQVEGEFGLAIVGAFRGDGFLPETRWHSNLGFRFSKREKTGYGVLVPGTSPRESGVWPGVYPPTPDDGSPSDNDALLLRTAVEFRRRWGHIFLELSTDYFYRLDGLSFQESPSWFTPGIYLGRADGVALKAAWSIGLFADDLDTEFEPTYPDWHFQAGISYPFFWGGRDRDEDGVVDAKDQCPEAAEDLDGFQDDDGCPDDDNDGDGIPDRRDLAPNLPEDFDGFQDEDGRPDMDNDLDGIVDEQDQCPNQAEDFNGFQDDDGCPDIVRDADGDGIEDHQDRCPHRAEDFDGFEDADGCPELDNDLDGIDDVDDKCPDDKEDYDGDEDDDGCPDQEGDERSSRLTSSQSEISWTVVRAVRASRS